MHRVLIVDDNDVLATLLAGFAKQRGLTPVIALNGAQAKASLRKEKLAIAIVDLHLPDIAPQVLLELTRKSKVPTICMSGVFKAASTAKMCLGEYGAVRFFKKPFDMRKMFDAVERIVGDSSPEEDIPIEVEGFVERPVDMKKLVGEVVGFDFGALPTVAATRHDDAQGEFEDEATAQHREADTLPPDAVDQFKALATRSMRGKRRPKR